MRTPRRHLPSRARGYLYGLILGLLVTLLLQLPSLRLWHARGPLTPGHEDLDRAQCHQSAPGTVRQQLQANTRHLLALRDAAVDLAYLTVDNDTCLGCHARPNDRHPVFRFLEPRFEKARRELGPQQCKSCHLEHTGRRVTVEPTYCVQCHQDIDVHDDPLDVPHAELARRGSWDTCLQCHDFHGNHQQVPPNSSHEMLPLERVRAYLEQSDSPYPLPKLHPALRRTPR